MEIKNKNQIQPFDSKENYFCTNTLVKVRREKPQLNHKKSKLLKGKTINSQNEIYKIDYLLELNQKNVDAINRSLITKKVILLD